MKTIEKARVRNHIKLPFAALALMIAIAPAAFANHHSNTSADKLVSVIGHLALPGSPASQIILQQHNGNQYLYLVRDSRTGFTIVDVTHPSQPDLVKRVAWPDGASAGQLQVVSNNLALAEGSEANGMVARTPPPAESLEFLDLSDPANPRTIQKFSGVTSVATDDVRNFVYVTNKDGLWVIKRQLAPYKLPACTSSDALTPLPDCY